MTFISNPPMWVQLEREKWSEIWTLTTKDGQSLDLFIEEVREWLTLRNADEFQMEKALDEAYHFGKVELIIKNPRIIRDKLTKDSPKLD
jgi:hypothetical protein